jgi:hypothetical protein
MRDIGRLHNSTGLESTGLALDLPWPSFVTQSAIARGVAGTPSVFVDGIPVPARPGHIAAAVERVFP